MYKFQLGIDSFRNDNKWWFGTFHEILAIGKQKYAHFLGAKAMWVPLII